MHFSQIKIFFAESELDNINRLQKGRQVMNKMRGSRRRKQKVHSYRIHTEYHRSIFCLTSVRTSAENNFLALEMKQIKWTRKWIDSSRFSLVLKYEAASAVEVRIVSNCSELNPVYMKLKPDLGTTRWAIRSQKPIYFRACLAW